MDVSSSNLTQPQIPQFNGKNYEYWDIQMKTLFCSQEIWDLVENGFTEPPNQAAYNVLSQAKKDLLKENKKKDAKALKIFPIPLISPSRWMSTYLIFNDLEKGNKRLV